MPVLKDRAKTTPGLQEAERPALPSPLSTDFTPPTVAPPESRDKTSPRESQGERDRAQPAPALSKSPISAALQGGGSNVSTSPVVPRGGGSFNAMPSSAGDIARSLSNRPMFGSNQGLTGGGLGVPGLEQTGSEAQPSPLLLELMKMFGR